MADADDLSQDRLAATLPVDDQGRPSIGGVSLLRKLGVGGMGAVYLGKQERLGREVAVKILPHALVEQDPDLVKRFQAEAKMAASIDSPHVVRVLDVGCEYDTNYYVMEYVAGESAGALLKKRRGEGKRGLAEREAVEVVRAATRGLAAAHAKGLVHRDIKPDNILIPGGVAGAAKLADLGLAKPAGGGASLGTRTGVAMGTPGFMAPEQAEDAKAAGPAADVFAMGATLHALISGDAPFRGASLVAILRATLEGKADPLPVGTGAGVQWLVARCLTPRAEERFADAAELLEALDRVAREPGKAGTSPVRHSQAAMTLPPVPASGAPSLVVASGPPAAKSRAGWFAAAGVIVFMAASLGIWLAKRPEGGAPPAAVPDAGAAALEAELGRAKLLEEQDRLGEALIAAERAAALAPESEEAREIKARIAKKIADTKTAARRTEDYQRALKTAASVFREADAQDTEEAWGKALAAVEDVRANASTDEDKKDVAAKEAEARARGDWAAAKALRRSGRIEDCAALARRARETCALSGLDAWIASVEEEAAGLRKSRERFEEMTGLERRAGSEPDEAALTLLESAVEFADADDDRARLRGKIAKARERIEARRIEAGDAAARKVEEERRKAAEAAREKEWRDAVAAAEAADRGKDPAAALGAWRRVVEMKADDARAAERVAKLTDQLHGIRVAKKGERVELRLEGGTGPKLEFGGVPAGEYKNFEADWDIRISRGFHMQTTEVTQAQWRAIMGDNPSAHQGDAFPVEQVAWYDIQEFLWRMNRRLDGWTVALPTECQWELACRGGARTKWITGDDPKGLERWCWFSVNSNDMTHEVGQLAANRFGLHDMNGNVAEMCHDFYLLIPDRSVRLDPVGPSSGLALCVRGSAYNGDASWMPCSRRGFLGPQDRTTYIGFRLALFPGDGVAPHTPRIEFPCDAMKKVPIEFAQVRAGTCSVGQFGDAESPLRAVTLPYDFLVQTTEVTQAQWIAILGPRDFSPAGPSLPATGVSWEEAQRFCTELGKRIGRRAGLPTEAEWEVACRAGASAPWTSGPDAAAVPRVSWFEGNASRLRPVAELRPNVFGLYDMGGNAAEWCFDWHGPLEASPQTEPKGPDKGKLRVVRGGSWRDKEAGVTCTARKGAAPEEKRAEVGFRVVIR